jgi:hypothetical protein
MSTSTTVPFLNPEPEPTVAGPASGVQSRVQVYFSSLITTIESMSNVVKSKIAMIQANKSAMSIGDMFDLQMAMNKLSQFSEMSTSVIAAMNTSINSMARNVKG